MRLVRGQIGGLLLAVEHEVRGDMYQSNAARRAGGRQMSRAVAIDTKRIGSVSLCAFDVGISGRVDERICARLQRRLDRFVVGDIQVRPPERNDVNVGRRESLQGETQLSVRAG